MDRLSGLASFGLVLLLVLCGLRGVHLLVPLVYPPADPGPHVVDTPAAAAELAGFAPWLPSYRPQRAGALPRFTVTRLGRPRIVVEWSGDHSLRITETIGDGAPSATTEARDAIWERDGVRHASARRGRVTLLIETDLSSRDLERVLASLREVRR